MTAVRATLLPLAALAVVSGLAAAAGAANTGTALGIGQIAFTVVLCFVLLRD